MNRFLCFVLFCVALVAALLPAQAYDNPAIRCWAVATFTDGKTPVVFRAERSGKADSEKKQIAKMLFEDFPRIEHQWSLDNSGRKLKHDHRFPAPLPGSPTRKISADFECSSGSIPDKVKKWPVATYTKMSPLSALDIMSLATNTSATKAAKKTLDSRCREWSATANSFVEVERQGERFRCRMELQAWSVHTNSDGVDERGAMFFHERPEQDLCGPATTAQSGVEAALRSGVAGAKYHLAGYAGACWPMGAPKAPNPGWSGHNGPW